MTEYQKKIAQLLRGQYIQGDSVNNNIIHRIVEECVSMFGETNFEFDREEFLMYAGYYGNRYPLEPGTTF